MAKVTTNGDIPYATAANALARLAVGAANTILKVVAGIPGWGLITSASPSDGIGYATGAGGTVTQLTSKSTSVIINKICGQITTHNAALAAGAEVTFQVSSTVISAGDVVILSESALGGGSPGSYLFGVTSVSGAGQSFQITIANLSAGSLSEAIIINFAIIKAVSA